jgi:pimeloyl-ACP methyl ester carboxylesterase
VIAAIAEGPVDLFATSGGAINALALVAAFPEDVRVLVAHEPPLAALIPDHEFALAACRDIHDTYLRAGRGPAMAKFIKIVSHQGPITADYLNEPGPDPQMFGMSADDDGSRYEPDIEALRRAQTRIVIGVGATSNGQLAQRGGIAVAELLDLTPVTFPGGHDGFLGGEYGAIGEPDAFAAKLREVLSAGS